MSVELLITVDDSSSIWIYFVVGFSVLLVIIISLIICKKLKRKASKRDKKRSDLTDAQKESLSKIDDLVAGRVTLEKIDAINVESSLKDITNYAKARGVNLKEVTGRSKKNKRLKAIKNNLKASNPEVKEKGIKELNEFIAEEQADTAKLLNKLEEAEQGVKDKVQRLGNERKRGKKREKISSIVSQTRSFLEERLEKAGKEHGEKISKIIDASNMNERKVKELQEENKWTQ